MTEHTLIRVVKSGVAYSTFKLSCRKQTALIRDDNQGERVVAYFKTAYEAELFREWLDDIADILPGKKEPIDETSD